MVSDCLVLLTLNQLLACFVKNEKAKLNLYIIYSNSNH